MNMDNDINSIQDAPQGWDRYSRLLRELPAQPTPPGIDDRLERALSAESFAARAKRRRIISIAIPGLSVSMVAIILWSASIDSVDTRQPAQPSTVTQAPATPKNRRTVPRRQVIPPPATVDIAPDTVGLRVIDSTLRATTGVQRVPRGDTQDAVTGAPRKATPAH
jgi:hypothetical protein